MLKAVLFDMDGVLVDTEPEYAKTDRRLAKQFGIPMTWREPLRYRGVNAAEMWTELIQKYGCDADPAEMTRLEHAHMEAYYHEGTLRPIRASVGLLKRCAKAGLKVAIATSSSGANAADVVRRLDLGEYVQAISVKEEAGRSKPAPDIFLLAAKLLSADPAECVVIEDADKGIEAAKAAGMKVVGLITPGSGQALAQADMVVRTLRGVSVEMLRGLVE